MDPVHKKAACQYMKYKQGSKFALAHILLPSKSSCMLVNNPILLVPLAKTSIKGT